MPALTRKNDLIIWVYLSEVQQRIYEEFSQSDEVKEVSDVSLLDVIIVSDIEQTCLDSTPLCIYRKIPVKVGIESRQVCSIDNQIGFFSVFVAIYRIVRFSFSIRRNLLSLP
jgi:hypothetical protein